MVRKEDANIQNSARFKAVLLWGGDPFRYDPLALAGEKLHQYYSNLASQKEQDSGGSGMVFEGEYREVDSEGWAEGPATKKWAELKRSGALYRGRRFGGRI